MTSASDLCRAERLSLCLSSGLHPSEEHLKDNYVTTQSEAPPDAPSAPCFCRMHRYDPSWPHISQDSLSMRNRRKKEREKMVKSRGVDRHFRGPGRQKSRLKDSPRKTTKAESFRGCRPWTETQHVNVLYLKSAGENTSQPDLRPDLTLHVLIHTLKNAAMRSFLEWVPA